MQARKRAGTTAAALAAAAVLVPSLHFPLALAHGGADHSAAAQAPAREAAPPRVNRWGANYFPNPELVTHEGKTVRFYDDVLKGKTVAINVVYTECQDVCPLETAKLVQVQKMLGERFGRDIVFYSISIDPVRDTPAVLKAYAEKYGARWTFLTGKPEDIKLVTKKIGVVKGRDLETRDGHGSTLVIGHEPTGQWTRRSALDNPVFLVESMGTFLGWRDAAPLRSYAQAPTAKLDDGESGEYLFKGRCAACHTIGEGDRTGPDLAGVTARRERAWLIRYVSTPEVLLAEGDPIANALFRKYREVRMPNIGLKAEDVVRILEYVHEVSARRTRSAQR